MSHLPEIRPRSLAERGTLTGDLMAGTAGIDLPPIEVGPHHESRPASRPARLEATAFGCSSTATEGKLEAILAGSGQLVTTGQQPLLFLGPLFVLYKALTAIELARRIEAATGTPTLAAFWIASDDHDWAEVGATAVLDPSGTLQHLSLAPTEGQSGRPVGASTVDVSLEPLLDELSQALPQSEFAPVYLKRLRDAYEVGRRLGEAFADALAHVLEPFEFAWLDSANPQVKRASAPFIRGIIDGGRAAEDALAEGARRLAEAGHEAPIPLLPDAHPVFVDTGAGRERLYRAEKGFLLGRDGEWVSESQLRAWLEDTPEFFSPNVASRPVLESWLLPVTATVLGPGEIAYWSQLHPLFDQYEVQLPGIQPRAAWTLVESKVGRQLDRLGASPEDLADGGAALESRITRDSRPPAVDAALAELRDGIAPRFDTLAAAIGEALPGLRSAAGKAQKQVFDAIGALGGRIDAGVREVETSRLQSVRKCAAHLFPDGAPQERTISPYYYLTRYGPELITELAVRTRASLGGTAGDSTEAGRESGTE